MGEGQRTGSVGRYGAVLVTLVAAYLVSAVTCTRWGGAVHVAFIAAIGALGAAQHAAAAPHRRLARAVRVHGDRGRLRPELRLPGRPGGRGHLGRVVLLLTVLVIVGPRGAHG